MGKSQYIFLVAAISGSINGWAASEQKICRDVVIKSQEALILTDTEKDLVCNDTKGNPWSRVPYWQKVYFLTNFLQARGYFFPQFADESGKVVIDPGSLVVVKTIFLRRNPLALKPRRYWQIYEKPLTTDLLNSLEELIKEDYAKVGFPCATLLIQAYPAQSLIIVDVSTGDRLDFPLIPTQTIPGIIPGVERRYDAMHTGEVFDPMLLDLSARRVVNDRLAVAASFTSRCTKHGIEVHPHFIVGKPNLVNFGIGFDTEEYLITELGWKNGRLLRTASSLESFARASYRTQLVRLGFNWYYAEDVTRYYLKSSLAFHRQNEKNYDSRTTNLKSGPYAYRDVGNFALNLWVAPYLRRIFVARGNGPSSTDSLGVTLSASAMTHDFEYYVMDPRSGSSVNLDIDSESTMMGSEMSVSSYALSATQLWNLAQYAPPIWILGIRAKLATTVKGNHTSIDEIPTNLKYRLGGTSNLRGFSRESIPPQGSLLLAYTGMELRMSNVLRLGIQPIAFVDAAKIGNSPAELSATTYWSPGLGINWRTPIGIIRGTAARGHISGKERRLWHHREGVQFYLSIGEQF